MLYSAKLCLAVLTHNILNTLAVKAFYDLIEVVMTSAKCFCKGVTQLELGLAISSDKYNAGSAAFYFSDDRGKLCIAYLNPEHCLARMLDARRCHSAAVYRGNTASRRFL